MGKTLEELILGTESQAAVTKAVQDAVARADAAGLPPAYEPDFSLQGLPPDPEKVARHRAAVAEEKAKDRRQLEFHQKALELMCAGGQIDLDMKRQALERLQLYTDRQLGHPYYVDRWRKVLEMPVHLLRANVLAETEDGHRLRKDTPLNFLRYEGGPLAE